VMTHEPASQSHGRSSKHGSHKKAATLMAVASESAAPGKQDRRSDGEVSNRAPTRCADRPVNADSMAASRSSLHTIVRRAVMGIHSSFSTGTYR